MILSFIISVVFVQAVLCAEHPFCKNPTTDPDFDPKWIRDNTPSTGTFCLYGNHAARQHWAQFVKGEVLRSEEDFSELCASTNYRLEDNKLIGDYRGYDNLIADRNCTIIQNGAFDCLFMSQRNPSYTDASKCYISYVDKKDFRSYHVVIWCFENGDIGWSTTVLKRRRITEEDKATIMSHLQEIGIDTKDTVELYTDACDK